MTASVRGTPLNKEFGRLRTIPKPFLIGNMYHIKCRCRCGNEIDVPAKELHKSVRSCGCRPAIIEAKEIGDYKFLEMLHRAEKRVIERVMKTCKVYTRAEIHAYERALKTAV